MHDMQERHGARWSRSWADDGQLLLMTSPKKIQATHYEWNRPAPSSFALSDQRHRYRSWSGSYICTSKAEGLLVGTTSICCTQAPHSN